MKADEVMLGDLVSLGGVAKHVTLAMLNTWSDDIKPIPLTPEIFEKNGYTHDKFAEQALIAEGATRDTSVLISSDHRVLINNASRNINSFNKWFIHVDTEDMRSMAGFEITHVHELQHALKLCGIGKEVVV